MAQHISVEKGSEKLSPPNHTHRRSLSGGTSSGPLTTLQKLADDSEAVQRVTTLQNMANARYSPMQRRESSHPPNGLPQNLKSGIENLSGISMADVTVQRNSAEPAKVGAHAFAQGTNIHLGPGQDKHLPHEAWHVVQQKQGRVKPTMQMKGVAINDDVGLEREADVMGARAQTMRGFSSFSRTETKTIQNRKQIQRVIEETKGIKGHGEKTVFYTSLVPIPKYYFETKEEAQAYEDLLTNPEIAYENNFNGKHTVDNISDETAITAVSTRQHIPKHGTVFQTNYLENIVSNATESIGLTPGKDWVKKITRKGNEDGDSIRLIEHDNGNFNVVDASAMTYTLSTKVKDDQNQRTVTLYHMETTVASAWDNPL